MIPVYLVMYGREIEMFVSLMLGLGIGALVCRQWIYDDLGERVEKLERTLEAHGIYL